MNGRTAIGWSVIDPDDLNTCHVLVRGGTVTLHLRPGDTCEILMDLVRRFDATVESLELPGPEDEWSYSKRRVRGAAGIWSEHSGGTAVDFNATRHPRGSAGTFSRPQRAAIRDLLEFYGGVVAWGGDFHTVPDEMHFEITVPPGSPLIKATARKVREAMEDDMPTADEVAEAVWQKFTHQAFTTGAEAGVQLDNRSVAAVALVGARAGLAALESIGKLSQQVAALAASTADDATKAQVAALGVELDGVRDELLTAIQQDPVTPSTP